MPGWLATGGMGVEKIAQYYDDPDKRRSDAHSFRTSIFAKRAALGEGLLWTAFRWGYYAGSQAGISSSTASSPRRRAADRMRRSLRGP